VTVCRKFSGALLGFMCEMEIRSLGFDGRADVWKERKAFR